jgi:hypothetical protein
MLSNKLNPVAGARINFAGYQKILDFTATGSEASKSVAVNGDVDNEYMILMYCSSASATIYARLNQASTGYGQQNINNTSGSITSSSSAYSAMGICSPLSTATLRCLTPQGLIKTGVNNVLVYSSGTTITSYQIYGTCYNIVTNVFSLDFTMSSGNFVSGTRIVVFARRA